MNDVNFPSQPLIAFPLMETRMTLPGSWPFSLIPSLDEVTKLQWSPNISRLMLSNEFDGCNALVWQPMKAVRGVSY